MLPGINPAQMKKMMQQMGIQNAELNAKRVIIELEGENIIIENPQVTKITMQGSSSYQVSGTERKEEAGFSKEDLQLVMEGAGVSEEEAKKALLESKGDIAEAIMKLKG